METKHISWQIDKSPPETEYLAVIRMGPASNDDEWGTITVHGARAQERAAMLIRAVNAHEAMVEALESCEHLVDVIPRRLTNKETAVLKNLRAALKLAKGEE